MKLFVSNLPVDATSTDLKEIFSRHGDVNKAWVVRHKATGQSRGFGFVEMTLGAAKDAMSTLDRSWYKNHKINVQKSRFRPRRQESRERQSV